MLIIAAWVFIQTPFGQNFIIGKVTRQLSKDLHTRVDIKHVDFSLFNNFHLQGVLIEDQQKDTLLYAGDVKVRITDWFFFKKDIELKYIGLENATIVLQRTDAIWNHQFLIDYFSSPSSSGKKEGSTTLNLKKIELKNIQFIQKDEWLGQNMTVKLSSLDLDAKEIDLAGKRINLDKLELKDPFFSLYNYPKKKPSSPTASNSTTEKNVADTALQWNTGGWIVNVTQLNIENGTFKTDRQTETPAYAFFDGRHIEFTQINSRFADIRWEKDTITTRLSIATQERSGFTVKSMLADVKLTPAEMAFANLDIKTNNSNIRNFFRMSFDDFSDMNDFIHKVRMQANFDNSEIDSDDIAFFAPALKTWKKNITIKGVARGTVDDLVGRNLEIQAGKNTLLNGDLSMTGLPDINQTFIDFKANDFRTTYDDAVAIVPAVRKITQPDLRKLQYIRFNGSFTGFISDFVTYGTIRTGLGTINSDLNMKLPTGQQPVYSGTISTDYFRLGDFIGDKNIGIVSLNGAVKGRGFDAKNRLTDVDGKVQFADYNGYRYSNVTLKGKLDKKKFDGIAAIDDKEVKLTLNGLIDFNNNTPVFNFLADVQKVNLKNINLFKEDIAFTGKFNLNFTGSTIDNFLGTANITEATLLRNGNPLPFDSLIVSSTYADNIKTIKASSNEFNATVSGDFNIRELPDAVKLFLNKYYPAYIKPPAKMPGNESLTFDITTLNVDDYIKLIDSNLAGFNNSHIYGNMNTNDNELNLQADIPQFKYQRYNFDDVKLIAKGTSDSLAVFGSTSNINISDSLNIPLALFRIQARNDSSSVKIFTGSNKAINQATLNAQVLTYNNGVKIEFDPSSFAVNSKTWIIDESGELEFRNNIPASGQLVLKESNQEVRLKTRPSETGDWNDLVVDLVKVNIGDFAPFLLPKNRLEGLLTGTVVVEDPTNNLYVSADNITGEGIRLDDDSLGNITTNLVYDNKSKQLKAKGKTLNDTHNVEFDLGLFLGSKDEQKNNLIALKANSFQLSFLNRFLGALFSDIKGYVTGDFDLRGPFNDLSITGKGRLQDAGLKINFTQCFYNINDTELELKPGQIDLTGIVLTDPVTRNPIYLNGDIQHTNFKDMFFGLNISTLKPNTIGAANNKPVQLLNTTYKDNQQFYGSVKGTGSFSLTGYEKDMYMKIDAIASTLDSSTVTIPSSSSRESGIADFLIERKYGTEMVDSGFLSGSSNVIYDVDVTANPMVTVKVILDDLTGDKIEGKGAGTLNIHSGTNEKLSMRGRFDIEEGEYLFTFQSFFKKPFKIKKGTENYISWSGDPMDAKIKFEAQYTAENVSFAPLADAFSFNGSTNSKLREDVYVVADLSGDLFKPKFKFRLEFPPNGTASKDFNIASSISQMEKSENEINRQVTYLIVFNSFAAPETGQATTGFGSTLNELTYNTISSISGLFFNEINRKLNSELSKILKTDNVSVNFSGSVYNRNLLEQSSGGGFNINQSNFNVNVPISMFKDRFVVTLGSTLDVPLQATIQQTVSFLPDVTAEWLINQAGTIRASFFYRQNLDYLTTNASGAARTKRSGASIAYRKEFDNLSDFFGGKKNKKENKKQPPPAPLLPEAALPKEPE